MVFENITIYTSGGEYATELLGHDAIWKDEDKTVYLSNNSSVYAPSGPVTPPEPYVLTLEELQEILDVCDQIIYSGVYVKLADNTTAHYSLTIEDQLNLFGKLSQISAGMVDEIQDIFYGGDAPKKYRSEVFDAYLTQIKQEAADAQIT